MAAQAGNRDAQFNVGLFLEDGIGVEANKSESVKWFVAAANGGDADAENRVGLAYAHGVGVAEDQREAVSWFRKAARRGSLAGMFNLGGSYAEGIGVRKNKQIAFKWFMKAAQLGYANAQHFVGYAYFYGEHGFAENHKEAVKWYRKSAAQSNPAASLNLGLCYLDGTGVRRNTREAKRWLKRASRLGNRRARRMLKELSKAVGRHTAPERPNHPLMAATGVEKRMFRARQPGVKPAWGCASPRSLGGRSAARLGELRPAGWISRSCPPCPTDG